MDIAHKNKNDHKAQRYSQLLYSWKNKPTAIGKNYAKHMMNEEFMRQLGQNMEREYSLLDNEAYVVNLPQMEKYLDVLSFFEKMAVKLNGEVDPLELIPEEISADLIAYFPVFNVYLENLQSFLEVMQYCNIFCLDSLDDGRVCISVSVPDVFVRKTIDW